MNNAELKNGPHFEMWVIGIAAGLVAGAVMYVVGQYGFMAAAFVGVLVALLVAMMFGMPPARVASAPEDDAGDEDHHAEPAHAMAEQAAADLVVSAPVMAEATPAAFVAIPETPVAKPAVLEPAKARAAAKPVAAKPAKVPAAEKPAVAKPTKAPAAEKPAAEKPAAVKPAVAKPAAAPKAPKAKKEDGPVRLKVARKGGADDLKEIEGIGPAMEKLVNGLGFYHFDQIAGWTDADVAWVDANMKTFKGRIVRDKWVAQAKIIVAEGLDAFRIRAKTNDY